MRGWSEVAVQIKGSFFLARRQLVKARFGAAAWEALIAELCLTDPTFNGPILATTQVPGASYVRFQEAVCRLFFAGRERGYWETGQASAQWALTDGPYAAVAQQGFEHLVHRLPIVWSVYFSEGQATTRLERDTVVLHITGNTLPHISVELTVMGFVERALELGGRRPLRAERVTGISDGDGSVIIYRFPLEAAAAATRSSP